MYVCILMINERKKVTPEINKHLFGQESKLLACVVDSRLNNAKLPKKLSSANEWICLGELINANKL